MTASRRIPPDTRQALQLGARSYNDWLESAAGQDEDADDEYHCDPLTLLERREQEQTQPEE